MVTKKKPARGARPAGKKGPANAKKSQSAKQTAKRPATARIKPSSVKAHGARPRVMIVPPSEPLFRATELDAGPKKSTMPAPTKPTPVRVARPPAKLPIPQSTYFF